MSNPSIISKTKKEFEIDFDKLKHEMNKTHRNNTETEIKFKEYESLVEALIKEQKYREALDLSIKNLNQLNESKIEDQNLTIKIKHNIVKLNNINAMTHLKKGDTETSKYLLDMCDKFLSIYDYESYFLTKNNFCCLYTNLKQFRSSKIIMNDLIKMNILRAVDKFNKLDSEGGDILENQNEPNKNFNEMSNDVSNDQGMVYNNLALDFSNLCAIDNKLNLHHESLINGLHSLAINRLSSLMDKLNNRINNNNQAQENRKESEENNNKKDILNNQNFSISYYNIAVQQEFLKRNEDSKISFSLAKLYELSKSSSSQNLTQKISVNKDQNKDDLIR